ncbi:MAG: Cof-type HAD-IIB family hydrolase [Candidatus Accumulibacter sp.]|jgi:Cof subfamily protein (haloacid dehalogenase superfamily)|nr:Cof-type HAD-IIB family hydrolase [Accumulibacter sp.]
MPRLFFFDLDNTLLDHRTLTIPPSALAAIDRLKRDGHTVAVATGRAHAHAKPFIDPLRPAYAITQNGACILRGDEIVLSRPLPRERLVALFDWMAARGHPHGVNGGASGYLSARTPMTTAALDTVAMPYQSERPIHLQRDVHQGWLFFDESLDADLLPTLRARFPEFEFFRWHRWAVDVQQQDVDKWTACQWVMARTGFGAEQAVAFGDGLNDVKMLQGVGLGIAMGNAHPALKAVADRIAPPIHLDGVARMLAELTGGADPGPAVEKSRD